MQTELNKIDVNIRRAKITSIQFQLDDTEDSLPDITVCLTLLTQGGKTITTTSLSTRSYYGDTRLTKDDIPVHVFSAIGTTLRELSSICTRKINAIDGKIEAKNV